jgi:hypothetical protein
MKARWGKTDYQRAQAGYMEFTAVQRGVMREHAAIRLANLAGESCAGASKPR